MAKVAQLHDNIDRTRDIVLARENILGRAEDATIRVENNVVSRHHARIACAPGTQAYFVEDVSARGTYVNFRRIKGRYPLKDDDRICVLRFYNVHPAELAKMTPEQLKDFTDDPRVEGIKAVADFTFVHAEIKETPEAQAAAAKAKAQGILDKLKALIGRK